MSRRSACGYNLGEQQIMTGKMARPPVIFIDTPARARTYMDELHAQGGDAEVAVDTEFDPGDTGKTVLMSYSWGRGVRRVVLAELVKEFYGDWFASPKSRIVYQNYKADAESLDEIGVETRSSFHADVMILGWLHDETLLRHGLKAQSLHFLHWRRQEYQKLFCYVPTGKKREVVLSPTEVLYALPPDALKVRDAAAWRQTMLDYSGDDAESTIALYHVHKRYLEEIGYWQSYLKIDKPYTLTLMACEARGVALDIPKLRAILRKVDINIMRAVHSFRSLAGKPDLNLNSIPQLQKLLIEEWGWPVHPEFVTAKGAPCINREALEWWADEHGYEIARVKMEYNNGVKLKGTFLQGLINGINDDGRLRSDFNQIGADTGRISSRKRSAVQHYDVTLKSGVVKHKTRKIKIGANLQNIPARKEKDPYGIRGAFYAPPVGAITAWDDVATEEHVLLVCDYSGFELCMAIHWVSQIMTGSPMLDIMQKYGSPSAVHAFTAIRLYAGAVNEDTGAVLGKISMDDWRTVKKLFPDAYTVSKNNNFNLLYGGSAKMMARLRGLDHCDPDVLAECQQQADDWNDLYTEIGVYQRHMIDHGDEFGWVPTISGRHANVKVLLEGRRPNGEEAEDDYEARKWRAFGERKCMNTPCQGSAADIVKVAMNYVERDEELRDLRCALLFPVHDELVLECPARHAVRALERTIQLMKKPFRKKMKFEIDVEGKFAANWQLAKG